MVITQQNFLSISLIFLTLFLNNVLSRSEKCTSEYHPDSNNFFGPRCCEGEEFDYGHLQPFLQKCSQVSPTDSSLSMEDSYWKLFGCLISSYLGPNVPVTMLNFVEAMTLNLNNKTRVNILQYLMYSNVTEFFEMSISSEELQEEYFESLKHMWTLYFDAEFHICHFVPLPSFLMDSAFMPKNVQRQIWRPSMHCVNGTSYPNIYTGEPKYGNMFSCIRSLRGSFDFENFTEFEGECMTQACRRVAVYESMTMEELKNNSIDFEHEMTKMVPKILSESVTQSIFDTMIKRSDPLPSRNLTNVISTEIMHANSFIESKDVHDEMKQLCRNIMVIEQLSDSFDIAKYDSCKRRQVNNVSHD